MKKVKGEDGFTLIEMMIVLLIISVLVLIAIPNVAKHSKSIDKKGCDAYMKMVQGQVEAYKIENPNQELSLSILAKEGYLPNGAKCPDGTNITIKDGEVTLGKDSSTENEDD